MWRLVVLLLVFLALHAGGQGQEFVVGGYLPDYRAYINVNATAPFLTDLILFSIQPSGDGCCLDENHYRLAREAQAYKQKRGHGTYIILYWFLLVCSFFVSLHTHTHSIYIVGKRIV